MPPPSPRFPTRASARRHGDGHPARAGPGETYRWRVVAVNAKGANRPTEGPAFTTYPMRVPAPAAPTSRLRTGPAALPDCRAYEMVSPVDKNGGDALSYFAEGFSPTYEIRALEQAPPTATSSPSARRPASLTPKAAPSPPNTSQLGGRPAGGRNRSTHPSAAGSFPNRARSASNTRPSPPTCATAGWSRSRAIRSLRAGWKASSTSTVGTTPTRASRRRATGRRNRKTRCSSCRATRQTATRRRSE